MNSIIEKSKGNIALAYFSLINRAGFLVVLFALLTSSMSANTFRYEKGNVEMNQEQTHFYNVILSDETTVNTHLFTFNQDLLDASSLKINLPDGSTYLVEQTVSNAKYGSRNVWVGRSRNGDEVHFAPHKEKQFLTGHLLLKGQIYSVRSLTGGLHVLIEYDDYGLESCGTKGELLPSNDSGNQPPIRNDIDGVEENSRDRDGVENLNDECYIRVLVGYTSTAAAAEADPVGLAMTAIALANTGYANSGINQDLELARVYITTYSDAGKVQGDVLDDWTETTDGFMDEVHSQRTLYRADMCALITNIGSGIAWVSTAFGNQFSCTRRTRVSGFTFHHELGHNHTCRHDPTAYAGSSNYRGYGHPSGFFRTVMAYACPSGSCTRVNEFSGPSNFYNYLGTNYVTGNATQNNVAGHNVNNGTIVAHQSIVTNGFYAGAYSFGADEYANFSGEDSIRYSSGANQMIYNNGSEGTMKAGFVVKLQEGFWAKSGSVFTASLEPSCSTISRPEPPGKENVSTLKDVNILEGQQVQQSFGVETFKAFPNPFSEKTTIAYSLNEDGPVNVNIFDYNGKLVSNLVSFTQLSAGEHTVVFDAEDLPTGIYHCKMTTKNGVKVISISLSR